MSTSRPARTGMTLVEVLVALTIFGVVISVSVAFMAHQNTAFQFAIQRLIALRNLRYAVATLSQDLETLGTNVPDGQPSLMYAGDDVIVFSADYATNVENDPFAVFFDPDAPTGQVAAPIGGLDVPNAGAQVADTVYEATPGVPSPAEVLLFFLRPDTLTPRPDDYQLFRQVNHGVPEVVARNLLQVGTEPFFAYEYLADDGASGKAVAPLSSARVPVHHLAPGHLAPSDTGRSALADSIRAVRVRLAATNGLSGDQEMQVAVDRLIPLPNAGFGLAATCGSPPLLGTALVAAAGTLPTGEPAVLLTWGPATDESGGEADVVRYVIWRRQTGQPNWGDPYVAIPAGAPAYTYQDAAVTPGLSYDYALAAQDCTPRLSGLTSAGPVIVP